MKKPTAKSVFINGVTNLIQNLLIDNPNYKNMYYADNSPINPASGSGMWNLLTDTKERAEYILNRIKETEHLIN